MTKSYLLVLLFVLCVVLADAQPPVIRSVTPSAAPVGSTVIIKGNRFSINADSNLVYFGTVPAVVNNASDSSISVTVPAGSSYMPVTVKVDTLTAFSKQPFTTSYGSNLQLRNNSFGEAKTIAAARYPCFGDFDADGRVDLAGIVNSDRIFIYRNTDSAGNPKFVFQSQYSTTSSPFQMISADFNADGKLDIALATLASASVSIYINTTTEGNNISFANPVYYLLFSDNYPYTLAANDIDGDGKTDMIISYEHQSTCFSVARNTSTGGGVSFAARVNFAFGTVPGGAGNVGDANKIYVADIDGDGKPDVSSLSRFFPPFLIYRNTSTPGTISFAAKVSVTSNRDITVGNGYFDMKLADIDGDNKPEIIYASSDSSLLSVYQNLSTAGSISFSPKINFKGPYTPLYVDANDLNGDGKVDIALVAWDSVAVFQNNSQQGVISFGPYRPYHGYYPSQDISSADLDADGKADIIISGSDVNNNNANRTHLLRNRIDEAAPIALCPVTDSIVLEPGLSGTTYQWQIDAGAGFINLPEDSFHTGTTSPLLVIKNPSSYWSGYAYRCVVDSTNGAAQYLRFTAIWTGSFNSVWENPLNWKCGQLPDINTDVIINNGFLTLNSNVTIRSFTIKPGVTFTISFGKTLTLTH